MQSSLVGGLLDLLAPSRCPGCGLDWHGSDASQRFCDACAPLIELAPPSMRPPASPAAAVLYQGPVADAIRRFKYARATDLAGALGELLVRASQPLGGNVDVVLPVPLHPTKLRSRGFNPALLLARPVARSLGVPLRAAWLKRCRATRTQAGLDADARRINLRGAFVARREPACRVLLIDDVWTTYATLEAASQALRCVGHDVTTLALAWAEGPASIPTSV